MTDQPSVAETVAEGSGSAAEPKVEPTQTPAKRDAAGKFSKTEDTERALDRIFEKHLPGRDPDKTPDKADPEVPAKGEGTGAVKVPKALELDGFTAEDLQGMTPERIAALDAKAQKRQADISKKLDERAKQEAQATAAPEAAKAAADTKAQAQQTYKELAKSVGDLLGDDVGDALGSVLEKALAPLVARLQEAETALQQRSMAEMDFHVAQAREKLGTEFPGLKDDEAHQEVLELMGNLADPKKFSSMEDLMRAACKLKFFDERVAAAAESKPRNDTSRNNGHVTPPVKRTTPPAAKTRAQLEDEALDRIFEKHLN